MGFGEDDHITSSKRAISYHNIKGTYYQYDSSLMLTLTTWLFLPDFSTVKLFVIQPLSILFSLEESHYVQPTTKELVVSTSLTMEYAINYLEFFFVGDLFLLPHLLIDLIIYLYQYRLVDIYFIL